MRIGQYKYGVTILENANNKLKRFISTTKHGAEMYNSSVDIGIIDIIK